MAIFGLIGLLVAFAAVAVSVICLLAGYILSRKGKSVGETLTWGGHIAAVLTAVALTVCCILLVFCFMTGDTSIMYVVKNQSGAEGWLGWLYKLSGLWGGREGSLLFWGWLLSVFNAVVAIRNLKKGEELDTMALLISQLVLAAFVGVSLFSEGNMPFKAMQPNMFGPSGNLIGEAAFWGMNPLLEHWAMAIHPPTLFIGYAGLTIPFAYAIAALVVNDASKVWVEKCLRYTIFSWFFLGLGIGLGAVWAYVVLGWGGYWGWDPVENASLLPWLVGVALIHSFTVYRKRGVFKRWSVMCACITFSFVILGTFITRSGLVQSVHAFEGDTVSLVLFLGLIILSIVAGLVGIALRWKTFGAKEVDGGDEVESFFSKDAAYYFNNVIMVVFATLLGYLTISSALPTWLPFGGQSLSAGTYNAIARPLGIVYCLILAICPLLAWGSTNKKDFFKRARIPALCALVLFIGLMVYFCTYLLPSYNDIIAAGGTMASGLSAEGPSFYYNGLAVFGFFVASLLFFNSLFMIGRAVASYRKKHGGNPFGSFFSMIHNRPASIGGFIAHLSMAIILVGLIGSSMYVTEKTGYVEYDSETDIAQGDFIIQDYSLKYTGNSITEEANSNIVYTVNFDVYKRGEFVGAVSPAVQLVQMTQQQKLIASVISFPDQDLFVAYRGTNTEGALSLDVRVNPLISLVWVGFGLMMIGIAVALFGRRYGKPRLAGEAIAAGDGDMPVEKSEAPAKNVKEEV
ncbi:MAG: cytochrome c biogenesis protein CcsA [Raoultibacter sp.]